MAYKNIEFTKEDSIGILTINRPKALNALNTETVTELNDCVGKIENDPEVKVLIITGSGKKSFVAGADIVEMSTKNPIEGRHFGKISQDTFTRIENLPQPVIAAVNGFALGGGCELACACDFRYAAENAKFGQTGPRVGSFDAGYGAGYLARMIGHKRAREVWFLCRQYTAAQAYEMGMVNTVVPFDKLEEETVQWCSEILELSPMALRMLKGAFNADTDGLAGLQQFAGDATLMYYTIDEAKEGRDAFKEKRKPNFKQFPKFP